MKNKKLLSLSVLCCSAMMLAGCGQSAAPVDPPTPKTYYTVTFMSEGEVFDTKQAEANDVVAKPATDPTKDDYDFVGWYTQEEGGTKWVFETDVVTKNMSLYAQFEACQVDYTVNILLNGEVVDSKITNSKDQNDVTLSGIAVSEGYSLLGYATEAGTTAKDVEYRVGDKLSYEQVVTLAGNGLTVNLNAIVKEGEILRLNVGLWDRFADENCMERILDAFEDYADENTIAYDFLDYTVFEAGTSSEHGAYWGVADYAAGVLKDTSIGFAFPVASNFAEQAGVSAVLKSIDALGVTIVNAKGEEPATGRYLARLSDKALDVAFATWLLSNDGKVVLDPEYVPSTEHGTPSDKEFYVGVWGRWYTEDETKHLVEEYEKYLKTTDIEYTKVDYVYLTGSKSTDPYYAKANYLAEMQDDLTIDIIFPVTADIANNVDKDIGEKLATKISNPLNLGEGGLGLTIGGKTDRYLAALNEDAITTAFITFCQTEDGKKALDSTYGGEVVEQTTLTISFYGKFISKAGSDLIMDALEEYFTAQKLTFTALTPDYVDQSKSNKNENYLKNMDHSADVSIGGKTNLTGFKDAEDQDRAIYKVVDIGTIKDYQGNEQANRGCFTFENGNLSNAVLAYFATEAWTTLLAQINAIEPNA